MAKQAYILYIYKATAAINMETLRLYTFDVNGQIAQVEALDFPHKAANDGLVFLVPESYAMKYAKQVDVKVVHTHQLHALY